MNTVIITAGGIGKRMNSELPKQFLLLAGKPVLIHAIQRFYDFDQTLQIIVTLPTEWKHYWIELQEKHQFSILHTVVDGGKERYHSIKNALGIASGKCIAIHDGVRPNVSHETIKSCFEMAEATGNAIPFLPIAESIRKIDGNSSNAANRSEFVTIQTPQGFQHAIIKRAYEQPFHAGITDDAGLVEQLGIEINLFDGNPENIKITNPKDLKIAELFI